MTSGPKNRSAQSSGDWISRLARLRKQTRSESESLPDRAESAARIPRSGRPRQDRGPRARRTDGRRGVPARASPEPLRRVLGRIRLASRVSAGRRPQALELEALRSQRQALRQAIRRRDQPRLPPRGRRERLDGNGKRGNIEEALRHHALGRDRPPGALSARRRRADAFRRARRRPLEAAGQSPGSSTRS